MSTVTALSSAERRKRLKLKRIVVSEQNYLTLKKLGHAGDSFNDVISKLLRIYWNYQEKQKQQQQEQKKQRQESDDANNGSSADSQFLFPPSFSEILDGQKKQQAVDLVRLLLKERKSSENNQTIK
jgi:predicted CopG family antitoxin